MQHRKMTKHISTRNQLLAHMLSHFDTSQLRIQQNSKGL